MMKPPKSPTVNKSGSQANVTSMQRLAFSTSPLTRPSAPVGPKYPSDIVTPWSCASAGDAMAVVAAIASAAGKSRSIGVPPHAPEARQSPAGGRGIAVLESTSDANARFRGFRRDSADAARARPVEPSSNEFAYVDYAGGLWLVMPGDEPRHLVVHQPVGRQD